MRVDDATVYELGMLIEDAGKVQNTIGRVLRSGLGATDICHGRSNREMLLQDLEVLRTQISGAERVLRADQMMLPNRGEKYLPPLTPDDLTSPTERTTGHMGNGG